VKPASYNDYISDSFPVGNENGFITKTFIGQDAPIKMDTEGVSAKEIIVAKGRHALELSKERFILSSCLKDQSCSIIMNCKKEGFCNN
jgi:hypothetical protein